MFKGIKPPAQPRSLRSIAEEKGATPAHRADGFEGSPVPTEYHDAAATTGANVVAGPKVNAADPQPFANLKGGR